MAVPHPVLDKAKVLVLFAFCLLNPFAGWAYLAQVRHERSLRPPAIADGVKPRRVAVLPLALANAFELEAGPNREWAGAFEIDFAELEAIEVVPLAATPASCDPERDVLELGRSVHADFILDASAVVDEEDEELRLYARLIRAADTSVRWSQLFVEESSALTLARIRDEVRVALLRAL